MTTAEKRNHQLAAVALEKHKQFESIFPRAIRELAVRAYDKCKGGRKITEPSQVYVIDGMAAALLRECIAKGEPLP